MRYAGEIAGLTTAFCWATSSFLWAEVGKKASPLGVNAFKSLVGTGALTAVLLVVLGQAWPSLTPRQLGLLAASGVVGLAIGDACIFTALKLMGPRRSLVMGLLTAPISAVLGLTVLGERIGSAGWTGMALTLVGIAVVQSETATGEGVTRRAILIGSAAGFAAALCTAIGSLWTKSVMNDGVNPMQAAQVRLASAGAALIVVGLVTLRLKGWMAPFGERRVSGFACLATLVGTVVGLSLMTYCIQRTEIGLASTLTSTAPLFSLPMAALIRHERVSARAIAGTVLAVCGVAVMFLR